MHGGLQTDWMNVVLALQTETAIGIAYVATPWIVLAVAVVLWVRARRRSRAVRVNDPKLD